MEDRDKVNDTSRCGNGDRGLL